MPDPLLYLKAMSTSAIVSAIVVLAMARWWRSVGESWLNSACVLSIVLGLATGYYVLALRLAWPPVNGLDRFLTVVVPAALAIEHLAGFQRVPSWLAWFLRTILAAAIPRILLHDSVYLSSADGQWTSWQAVVVLAVASGLLVLLWSLLSWLSRRSPGSSLSLALSMAILCAGATIMMAGYVKGGSAAFPLAITLIVTTVSVRLTTSRSAPTSHLDTKVILGIGVVGLFGLLSIGRFFGELSDGCSLAILLSPLLCWVTEIPLLRNRNPWIIGTVRLIVVAIPLLIVLAEAKLDFDREMAPLITQVELQQ
ncbi:MAG: hypothetical protein ACKVHE_24635 [Planctomycetales bacterium]|jgi:hypothetical protein